MQDAIREIQQLLQAGAFPNEAAISQGVVRRLLGKLGWPEYNPSIVWPEYNVQGTRVDFALCHPPSRPCVFIEVKQPGANESAEQQLFQYAFHAGVPLVILTTGQEWHFYLPAKRGDYGDRRVYGLDLVQRDVAESAKRLERYLNYAAVQTGEAQKNAEHDYEDLSRTRQVVEAIPQAWQSLIEEMDDLLIDLVAEKTESLCGYKPDSTLVQEFLLRLPSTPISPRPALNHRSQIRPQSPKQTASTVHPVSSPPPAVNAQGKAAVKRRTSRQSGTSIHAVTILGRTIETRNNREAIRHVLVEFSRRDSAFLSKFVEYQGDGRQYVSQNPQTIHPNRDDYHKHVWEITGGSGWYMNVNLSTSDSMRFIQIACEVAQLQYGRDVLLTVERNL